MLIRALEPLLIDFAVREKLLGVTDAPELQTFKPLRLELRTQNEFRATATNVDNQSATLVIGERMRNAQIDESRFFPPVDDVDGHPKNRLGGIGKHMTVMGLPQRVCSDRADFIGLNRRQELLEAFNAGQPSLDSIVRQLMVLQSLTQLHFFGENVKRANFSVLQTRNN